MDSPNTWPFASSQWGSSSAAAWQPVSSTSSTSTPSPTELIVTSQNLSQTFSSIPSSYPSTSSTQDNAPIKDSSLPTSEISLDDAQPTVPSSLPSHTEYTSEIPLEEAHVETTTIWTPSSAVSSNEDLNQSSQSLHQIQTAKPEITTTNTYSFSQNTTLYAETSYEPSVSLVTTSQQSQTQFDTSGTLPSGQSTLVTTLRDDSLTEVTSPLPIATSTGKSEHSVASAETKSMQMIIKLR
jgi:hypothetical protein